MKDNDRDYNGFYGKKILLLGAHVLTIHLINKAREMGIYTIVTDYVKDAPAKKVADEAYDISTLDVDALIQLAREKNVDGVFTGYVDINLAPCCQVCNALGLPFYATLEQLEQTMNKEEMAQAINKAYDMSTCKQIVAEQFIDAEDVYLYFTIQNGKLSLSAMADRLLNEEQYGCAPQPVGYFFHLNILIYITKKCMKIFRK